AAIRLVRAFSTYFNLANVAEQVHRGRELAGIRERDGGWLSQAVDRIAAAGMSREELAAEVSRLGVRPVFTAHPTEAARRTVLYKLREVADLLEAGGPRLTARLEETIDLLWQTDELRIASPDVVDEARNAVWYFDGLHADAVPHVLEQLAGELRRLGLDPDPERRPLVFGSWIGGDRDGNPNVEPESVARVLGADRGRDAGAARVARARPRAAAGGGAALPAPQRRGALPAEAHLHPAEAREHAPAPGERAAARAGPGLRGSGRPARRAATGTRLARRAPRRSDRARPPRARHAHPGRVRAAPGDAGRARARGRASPRDRPAHGPSPRGPRSVCRALARAAARPPRSRAVLPAPACLPPAAARRCRPAHVRHLRGHTRRARA